MLRSGLISRRLRLGKSPKAKPCAPKPKAKVYAKVGAIVVKGDGREVCSNTALGRAEYQARLDVMALRQHGLCALCGLPFNRFSELLAPSFEHERPRGNGGAWRDDRLTHEDGRWRNAATHISCNTEKGSKHYEWRGGQFVPVEGRAA